jgi:acyl-CoA synthetase (AMP-forming)/AMP-acid ligase II
MPDNFKDTVGKSLPHIVMENFLSDELKNKTALVCGGSGQTRTFSELHSNTHKFAKCLLDMGVEKGDCVGIISPNNINFFSAFQGIGLTGATSTPINPLYTEHEIEYQLVTTHSKIVIAHPFCFEKTANVAKKLNIPIIALDPVEGNNTKTLMEYVNAQESNAEVKIDVDPNAIMTLPFSSGTTGVPKGVALNHKSIIANLFQLMPQEGKYYGKDGVMMVPLPFFHIYGMVVGCLLPLWLGNKTVFMPAFDLVRFLELVQEHKCTRLYCVPPIILGLAKHPIIDNYDLSSVESILSGAAPLGGDVQELAAKRLGCKVKQAWGMTELSPAATVTSDDEYEQFETKGKCGRLVPGTEAKIVSPETGEDMSPFEEGELLIRGPQVMTGYYNNEEATKNCLRDDGFMHTGDIAKFDKDGWLQITDRCKELIKYKGFQVAPAELEALINSLPTVKDVVVIPVLDDDAGEIPRAYVVPQDGVTVTEQDILDFVHEKVSAHKKLRGGIRFVPEVPRSASGKLLRRVQVELDRAGQ